MVVTSCPSWVGDVVCRLWGERGSVFDLSSQLREQLSAIKPESDELRLLARGFLFGLVNVHIANELTISWCIMSDESKSLCALSKG
ncbi:unnamed protein product [Angiostrongylus costaricensis]|uniref:PI3K/PI4K domain-containing protein n=1 Tax=Angiostrongylus costaricensis TaxID=334426 RepID=A0A0R3PWN7_ANGCS|nr:unnamed protein product [Angiostrongylus costaricensis]